MNTINIQLINTHLLRAIHDSNQHAFSRFIKTCNATVQIYFYLFSNVSLLKIGGGGKKLSLIWSPADFSTDCVIAD